MHRPNRRYGELINEAMAEHEAYNRLARKGWYVIAGFLLIMLIGTVRLALSLAG